MKHKWRLSFLPHSDVYQSKMASGEKKKKKKCRAGHDFVLGELIGWLWFAIDGFNVSDRLPRPHHQRSH